MIRTVRVSDLPALQDIERAAGRIFAEIGMPEIAADDPPSLQTLSRYQHAGRAWVWVGVDNRPAAYLIADIVDGNTHIEQISVHPMVARRGVGRELIEHVAVWSKQAGRSTLTLTTFAEVPWNGPYYQRCGFSPVPAEEMTPGLVAIRRREAEHGLDRWPRVTMRRTLNGTA